MQSPNNHQHIESRIGERQDDQAPSPNLDWRDGLEHQSNRVFSQRNRTEAKLDWRDPILQSQNPIGGNNWGPSPTTRVASRPLAPPQSMANPDTLFDKLFEGNPPMVTTHDGKYMCCLGFASATWQTRNCSSELAEFLRKDGYAKACKREFGTSEALLAHCTSTSDHKHKVQADWIRGHLGVKPLLEHTHGQHATHATHWRAAQKDEVKKYRETSADKHCMLRNIERRIETGELRVYFVGASPSIVTSACDAYRWLQHAMQSSGHYGGSHCVGVDTEGSPNVDLVQFGCNDVVVIEECNIACDRLSREARALLADHNVTKFMVGNDDHRLQSHTIKVNAVHQLQQQGQTHESLANLASEALGVQCIKPKYWELYGRFIERNRATRAELDTFWPYCIMDPWYTWWIGVSRWTSHQGRPMSQCDECATTVPIRQCRRCNDCIECCKCHKVVHEEPRPPHANTNSIAVETREATSAPLEPVESIHPNCTELSSGSDMDGTSSEGGNYSDDGPTFSTNMFAQCTPNHVLERRVKFDCIFKILYQSWWSEHLSPDDCVASLELGCRCKQFGTLTALLAHCNSKRDNGHKQFMTLLQRIPNPTLVHTGAHVVLTPTLTQAPLVQHTDPLVPPPLADRHKRKLPGNEQTQQQIVHDVHTGLDVDEVGLQWTGRIVGSRQVAGVVEYEVHYDGCYPLWEYEHFIHGNLVAEYHAQQPKRPILHEWPKYLPPIRVVDTEAAERQLPEQPATPNERNDMTLAHEAPEANETRFEAVLAEAEQQLRIAQLATKDCQDAIDNKGREGKMPRVHLGEQKKHKKKHNNDRRNLSIEAVAKKLNEPPGMLKSMLACYDSVNGDDFRNMSHGEQRKALSINLKSTLGDSCPNQTKCGIFAGRAVELRAYNQGHLQPLSPDSRRHVGYSMLVALAHAKEVEEAAQAHVTRMRESPQHDTATRKTRRLEPPINANWEFPESTPPSSPLARVASAVTPVQQCQVNTLLSQSIASHEVIASLEPPVNAWDRPTPTWIVGAKPIGGWIAGMPAHVATCGSDCSQLLHLTAETPERLWVVRHFDGTLASYPEPELSLVPGVYHAKNKLWASHWMDAHASVSELNNQHKHLVGWALQVRLSRGTFETHVCTKQPGDTFMELAPNFLHSIIPLVDAVRTLAFLDIGAGTGLQLVCAAIIGQFDRCFGVERNVLLVDQYRAWCEALLECDRVTWTPILATITMVQGDISECSTLVPVAALVLCWNACFEAACNDTLFGILAHETLPEGAVLILSVGLQDNVPKMTSLVVPNTSNARQCLGTSTGKLPGKMTAWRATRNAFEPNTIVRRGRSKEEPVPSNGTPLDQDRQALVAACGQQSIMQPWMIVTGAPMSCTFETSHTWEKIDLGGSPRRQKAITCNLGNGIDVLSAYALENTDFQETDMATFESQRPHQHLHCDLPNPRVAETRTSTIVADAVYVLIAPLGAERIAIIVWDHTTNDELTLWVEPGQYMVFPSASCWHAGYGGKQGARLYVTFFVGKLTSHEKECVTHDQLQVLLWKHIHGRPSPNPENWCMKKSWEN